ncbi:MAG: type II secretion system F family protein, partial [Candidatus Wallbacteria bacterium]|nr:type II secretion system F family protein [Candidatus Wallbacteria bacterium]
MALFKYEASNPHGTIISGQMEAVTKDEAIQTLERQGLVIIKVKRTSEVTLAEMFSSKYRRVSLKDLFLFTKYFTIVLKAGIPVIKGLVILRDQTENLLFKRRLSRIITAVESGAALNEAFSLYPDLFPPIFCNLVKVGEESGLLYEMMARLSKYMEKSKELRRKIKG